MVRLAELSSSSEVRENPEMSIHFFVHTVHTFGLITCFCAYVWAHNLIFVHTFWRHTSLQPRHSSKIHHTAPITPSSFAEQEFSRTTCFANGSYGLDSIQQMNRQPSPNGVRRISTTNNSNLTTNTLTTDTFKPMLMDVSPSLPDNGQTSFTTDSLGSR